MRGETCMLLVTRVLPRAFNTWLGLVLSTRTLKFHTTASAFTFAGGQKVTCPFGGQSKVLEGLVDNLGHSLKRRMDAWAVWMYRFEVVLGPLVSSYWYRVARGNNPSEKKQKKNTSHWYHTSA